jgi:hypothetical protein
MTFRKSKYNNRKTEYNGVIYDSSAEADGAKILDKLLADGRITSIERQVRFALKDRDGGNRMYYRADFVVVGLSGSRYIIDIKGFLTDAFKIKAAYFRYVYNEVIHVVPTTGPLKFNFDFIV